MPPPVSREMAFPIRASIHPARRLSILTALLGGAPAAVAAVLINEVMYHPPDDRDELQFIELHNTASTPTNLTGWRFSKGVDCQLSNVVIPPGGFAVICRDARAFRRHYGTNLSTAAVFQGRLKHGGERLQLDRPDGSIVDTLKYADRAPWPTGPDGYGSSLERRAPGAVSDHPSNWGGSALPKFRVASGTPGRTNSVYTPFAMPWVSAVTLPPVLPERPIPITAEIQSPEVLKEVRVLWRAVTDKSDAPEQSLPMSRVKGSDTNGTWQTTVPPQPSGRMLRLRVEATDAKGSVRAAPDPNDPRPTFSAFVIANTNTAAISQVRLVSLGTRERPGSSFRRGGTPSRQTLSRGESFFVVLPTNGAPVQTFDYIRLTPRQDGWKVRLHKDQPYADITTLNLVHAVRPRWLLAEPLAYELFRHAGSPTPLAGHVRAWFDNRPLGYCLYVEQPNASFLRRVGRDPDGNLYKLLWYTQGLEGQHEKKNNQDTGHDDLVALVNGLESQRGNSAWPFIEQNFDVESCANYFAVGQCVQNWDGCFNNYFTYHAPGPKGRWDMIPWDLDKTWGDYDGASPRYNWYTLPLTYGMAGDRGPSGSWFGQRGGPWGSAGWWRPPGWFSGPLLANPTFREHFLKRIAELCRTEFSEERFGPVISSLETRLSPEVRVRAEVEGIDPASALAEFRENISSFRRQLTERRAYLLGELAKAGVAPR